jgi:hypothetical protein
MRPFQLPICLSSLRWRIAKIILAINAERAKTDPAHKKCRLVCSPELIIKIIIINHFNGITCPVGTTNILIDVMVK